MAQKLGQDAAGTAYATQQINQIGMSSEEAARKLIQGGESYEANLRKAMPQAERALYGQAAAGLAAGYHQAGRGGASAYGGALQGGLQSAQQLAGFGFTSAQQLADAAKMQSEGLSTQAAAASKMLEFGTEEQRIATAKLTIEKQIQDAINAADQAAWDGYDEGVLASNLAALEEIYKGDPVMLQYIRERSATVKNKYKSGFGYLGF